MNAFTGQLAAPVAMLNDWERALLVRQDANTRYRHHSDNFWSPAGDELDRIAPRPDLWFEISAKSGQTARYFVDPKDIDGWDNHWSALFRTKAGEIRDAWLAHLSAREALGWDRLCEENTRLCDLLCDAERELVLMPAPDIEAFMWKLRHLFDPEARDPDGSGASWCAEWMDALMSDAERLLGAGQIES